MKKIQPSKVFWSDDTRWIHELEPSDSRCWIRQSRHINHPSQNPKPFCKTRIRKIADDYFLDCSCCSCLDPFLIRVFSFRVVVLGFVGYFRLWWIVSHLTGIDCFWGFCGIVYLWVAKEVEQMLLLGSGGGGWGICSSTIASRVCVC
jgi:hypothetical protein